MKAGTGSLYPLRDSRSGLRNRMTKRPIRFGKRLRGAISPVNEEGVEQTQKDGVSEVSANRGCALTNWASARNPSEEPNSFPLRNSLCTLVNAKTRFAGKNAPYYRRGRACEAQLWTFTGPPKISGEENTPEAVWVAAESLDAALQYVRQRHDDFIITITAARLVGMVALLSGSPLD